MTKRPLRRLGLAAGALSILAAPALLRADGPAAGGAPADLRQIQQALHAIRALSRVHKWSETEDLILRIKKTFVRSMPQLLTRVSPDELSRYSYALASLEEGMMSQDLAQLDQGFHLSQAGTRELENKFPDQLDRELGDLQQSVTRAAALGAQGDLVQAQDYLEDIAAARKRLDNACMAYAKESWVHFALTAETLARAVRTRNVPQAKEAAEVADGDIQDIRDRVPGK